MSYGQGVSQAHRGGERIFRSHYCSSDVTADILQLQLSIRTALSIVDKM